MRLSLSWLADHVTLPPGTAPRAVADALVRAGIEVESVDDLGAAVTGPLVVGRVLTFVDEPQKNGKTIRWCTVEVGEDEPRGIVCGAHNFAEGDLVVVALPGTVLPGGFAIARRKTYGHFSDGMICSVAELGTGDDHDGILVLDPTTDAAPGADARPLLGLDDVVLDLTPTPDRGYAMSVRGIARELATAFDVPFRDPVSSPRISAAPADEGGGWPVRVDDPAGCSTFVAMRISGFDPDAPSPDWLRRRVQQGGMRSISLAVDVTNYVMLDLGQPLHAYDAATVRGQIVVRRAGDGATLTTLDGATRTLAADDLLITDDSGPIGIAGVMGGGATEITAATTDLVLEAAHFDAATVSRTSRAHRLASEASRRYERGVDIALALPAARRAAALLADLGGGKVDDAVTVVRAADLTAAPISMAATHPGAIAGRDIPADAVIRRLGQVGCRVRGTDGLVVHPPTWRGDLRQPADLVEEVLRLEGYDTIASCLPTAPAGRGLTPTQRLRRRIGRTLAYAGYVEAPNYPFVAPETWDAFGLDADDPRRRAVRVVNPISDETPLLRTTLLPGLLDALRRNVGRGAGSVALFEIGQVVRPRPDQQLRAPVLGADRRPTDDELAAQQAALPDQPQRVAVVLAGDREQRGWWGPGRPVSWADAVEAGRLVAAEAGVDLSVSADIHAPWHPGRCAVLRVGDRVVGHAGELHPRTVAALDLPAGTAAMEIDLDLLGRGEGAVVAPGLSTFPVATRDVALLVDTAVPAAEVERALRDGAGDLLEDVILFDRYEGDQAAGRRSLAYRLRLRGPDRTLTADEANAARDAAVAEAVRRTGATLRGAGASE